MFEKKPEEYLELDMDSEGKPMEKIVVQVDKMENYADSDRIQNKVREGSILLVKIKELRERDMSELKRAIERIKKTCAAINGDIAGIGDDWLVVTPAIAKVHREVSE